MMDKYFVSPSGARCLQTTQDILFSFVALLREHKTKRQQFLTEQWLWTWKTAERQKLSKDGQTRERIEGKYWILFVVFVIPTVHILNRDDRTTQNLVQYVRR